MEKSTGVSLRPLMVQQQAWFWSLVLIRGTAQHDEVNGARQTCLGGNFFRQGNAGDTGINTINAVRSRDPLFYQAKNGACRAVASVFDVGAYESVLSTLDHSPSRYP